MGELPSGNVTFLFTDVEGSTQMLERDSARMAVLLTRHHELLREAAERHNGQVFETFGDAVCAAFSRPSDALAAALAGQQALLAEKWPEPGPIRVRMGLHTGEVELHGDSHYIGAPLFRVARLMSIGHGSQVLLSTVTAALVRGALPPGASLRDMGNHRLKDLAEPEGVFQLMHSGLPDDFPALRSLDSLPNNLPVQLTSFVGREKELVRVKSLLGASRLLTITGSGGSGKTRLALQAAADVLDHYPDGAWLADMGPLNEGLLVPQTVAAALGLHEEPGQPIRNTVLQWLDGKKLLLVMDNCEHLVDACAHLVEAVLRSCPGVQVLVTSRAALGIGGETTWRVPSLGLADPDHLPSIDSLTQFEAVRLFIDRAVAARPDFRVNNQNAAAVAQICHRLDGIPLAIELAAARIRVLSPDQISARLNDRFQLLTGGSRTALPRQQTLRALVDWSYDLLSDNEKALFRRLSVFASGWSVDAAEAICAGDSIEAYEVLDLITALIDKSLIVAEDQDSNRVRYRLLETLRQYAHEKLAADGELGTYEGTHMHHYLELARDDNGRPGRHKSAWLDEVEQDIGEFRQHLARLKPGHPQPLEATEGIELVKHLGRFWYLRENWAEGRDWIAAALAKPGADKNDAYGHALFEDARLAVFQGNYAEARAQAKKAFSAASKAKDSEAMCGARWVESLCATATGDRKVAESAADDAVKIFEAWHKRPDFKPVTMLTECHVVQGYAKLHRDPPDPDGALQAIDKAVAIARACDDKDAIARALTAKGQAAKARGNWEAAAAAHDEAIKLNQELKSNRIIPALYRRGDIELDHPNGDLIRADGLYRAALDMAHRTGARRMVANALRGLAAVQARRGSGSPAATLLACSESLLGKDIKWVPDEQAQADNTRAAAKAALPGADFDAAWKKGATMTEDQSVEYVRKLPPAGSIEARPAPRATRSGRAARAGRA